MQTKIILKEASGGNSTFRSVYTDTNIEGSLELPEQTAWLALKKLQEAQKKLSFLIQEIAYQTKTGR